MGALAELLLAARLLGGGAGTVIVAGGVGVGGTEALRALAGAADGCGFLAGATAAGADGALDGLPVGISLGGGIRAAMTCCGNPGVVDLALAEPFPAAYGPILDCPFPFPFPDKTGVGCATLDGSVGVSSFVAPASFPFPFPHIWNVFPTAAFGFVFFLGPFATAPLPPPPPPPDELDACCASTSPSASMGILAFGSYCILSM